MSSTPQTRTTGLGAFAALTLALSWLPWAALIATGTATGDGPGATALFVLGSFGPTLAAAALWVRGRAGLAPLRARAAAAWPALALLLGAAPTATAALALNTGDLSALPQHAAAVAASVGGAGGVLGYTLISGPLAEEFGWRGYAQPRMRATRGPARTAAVLGGAWALWHLPLFFIEGTGQHAMGLFSWPGALFFPTLLPLSYLILFASEYLGGGVWAAVLAHASWNAADALLPELGTPGLLLRSAVTFALAAAVALYWRAQQRRAADPPQYRACGRRLRAASRGPGSARPSADARP
ncbi:CPBP family intramembrane glutamic endopeptidase [Nocardiopsis coralliicola]